MKKKYKKPHVGFLPIKCHVKTLSKEEPENMNKSRRGLLAKVGLVVTVGQLTPLYASTNEDGIPF